MKFIVLTAVACTCLTSTVAAQAQNQQATAEKQRLATMMAVDANSRILGVEPEFTVTNTSDSSDGVCDVGCSLREAIEAVNAAAGGSGTIVFSSSVFSSPQVINLAAALPDISNDLTLQGPGADLLTVRRDSGGDYTVFTIPDTGLQITMSGLTISNGNAVAFRGGGFSSASSLTLTAVVISNNQADGGGGIGLSADGLFTRCTISGNSAGQGAGIDFLGGAGSVLQLVNSTVSGNTGNQGSAIQAANLDHVGNIELKFINSTITGNIGNWTVLGRADGSDRSVSVTLTGTILANNSGTNLVGLSGAGGILNFSSLGYNLADDNGSLLLGQTGDQIDTDPLLGQLSTNGGPTPTHSLSNGSPAIDAGSCVTSGVSEDQRGVARPFDVGTVSNVDDGCDIGAFEWIERVFDDGFETVGAG